MTIQCLSCLYIRYAPDQEWRPCDVVLPNVATTYCGSCKSHPRPRPTALPNYPSYYAGMQETESRIDASTY